MAPMEKVLSQLFGEQEEQKRVVESETAKLGQINAAIAYFQNNVLVIDPAAMPKRRDYEHMGIVEAAKAWLAEVGSPQHTEDIAKVLLERGLKTRSKRMTPNVYSTLNNAKKSFVRDKDNDTWRLKEKE